MKQFMLILGGIMLLQVYVKAQDYDNAGSYMDIISKQNENISKKFLSYNSAAAHGKRARKVESLRMKLLDEVQEARMNISGMPSFKGDKSLRDTSVSFMKLYYNILNEDYSKIINLEDIAEQSYDDMEAYLMAQELVDKKLEEGNDKMVRTQREFAKKNNITLIETSNDIDDMMRQVGEVNSYYHQVYLLFFKPYNQEANMLEAMQKNNITGMEQNKSSMARYAQEGIQKLSSLQPFQGDNSLITACRKMLDFYISEGEKMQALSDYFLTKERFEKIQKEFEKKSEPSKQEVDAYNKSVNDINSASKAYNSTNQEINKQRNEFLNDWNRSVNSFFAGYTPKYR